MPRATLRSAAVLALALAALAPGVARADGDPASDVLYTQGIFVPQDAGVPAADVARLAALVRESRRAGYPVKVAIVAVLVRPRLGHRAVAAAADVRALPRRRAVAALPRPPAHRHAERARRLPPRAAGDAGDGRPPGRRGRPRQPRRDRGDGGAAARRRRRTPARRARRGAGRVERGRRRDVARDLDRVRRSDCCSSRSRGPSACASARSAAARKTLLDTRRRVWDIPLAKSLWALGFTGTRHFWGRFSVAARLSPRRTSSSSSSRRSRTPSRRA